MGIGDKTSNDETVSLRTTVYLAIYRGDDLNMGQAKRATDRVMAILPSYTVPVNVQALARKYLNSWSAKPEWRDLYRFILTLQCDPEPEWVHAAREAGWTPPDNPSHEEKE